MSQFSQVDLDAVDEMLRHCAPGATWQTKKHRHWVRWNTKTSRNIPLGPHGRRAKVTVDAGHIRSMVRHLGIDPTCASRFIPMNA